MGIRESYRWFEAGMLVLRRAVLLIDPLEVIGLLREQLIPVDVEDRIPQLLDRVFRVVLKGLCPESLGVHGMVGIGFPHAERGTGQVDGCCRHETRTLDCQVVREATQFQQVHDNLAEHGVVVMTRSTLTGMTGPEVEVDKVYGGDEGQLKIEFPADPNFQQTELFGSEGVIGNVGQIVHGRWRLVFELGSNPSARAVERDAGK